MYISTTTGISHPLKQFASNLTIYNTLPFMVTDSQFSKNHYIVLINNHHTGVSGVPLAGQSIMAMIMLS